MARMGIRNKQKLYYSNFGSYVDEIEKDSDGNPIYDYDGTPIYTGEKIETYGTPVEFHANISMSGGEVEVTEYGLDPSEYSAVIVFPNSLNLPINENSVIWHKKAVEYLADGTVDYKHSEYTVSKVDISLNFTRVILKKRV